MKIFVRVFSLGVMVMLCSCATDVKKVDEKEEIVFDKVVGRVASVNKSGKYLLIQRYGAVNLEGDKVFYVRGVSKQMSSLRVTGERLGQFIAADIVNGEPVVGDAVFERLLKEKVEDELGDVIDSVTPKPTAPVSEKEISVKAAGAIEGGVNEDLPVDGGGH